MFFNGHLVTWGVSSFYIYDFNTMDFLRFCSFNASNLVFNYDINQIYFALSSESTQISVSKQTFIILILIIIHANLLMFL